MLSYASWIGATNATASERAAEEDRHAVDTWQVIQDNPVSLVFRKQDGSDLAAQSVRLDSYSAVSDAESAAGLSPRRKIVITGVKGHPTLIDTDIAEGYRFIFEDDEYRVTDILPGTIGEVQAIAEAAG